MAASTPASRPSSSATSVTMISGSPDVVVLVLLVLPVLVVNIFDVDDDDTLVSVEVVVDVLLLNERSTFDTKPMSVIVLVVVAVETINSGVVLVLLVVLDEVLVESVNSGVVLVLVVVVVTVVEVALLVVVEEAVDAEAVVIVEVLPLVDVLVERLVVVNVVSEVVTGAVKSKLLSCGSGATTSLTTKPRSPQNITKKKTTAAMPMVQPKRRLAMCDFIFLSSFLASSSSSRPVNEKRRFCRSSTSVSRRKRKIMASNTLKPPTSCTFRMIICMSLLVAHFASLVFTFTTSFSEPLLDSTYLLEKAARALQETRIASVISYTHHSRS
mmetsp:Transcript_44642/g.105887  ORF Transcript_44642/g.105887 Transcript_44642/m.105887 type:complete len:327 (-) Transcript_44642:653-1633(-)